MKKSVKIIIIVVLLLLLGLLIYYLIDRNTPRNETLTIATIWDVPNPENMEHGLDFTSSSAQVQEARSGFVKAMNDFGGKLNLEEIQIAENEDLRGFVTDIADIYTTEDILMTIGASSDEKTMYTAMEMEYFQIPMLIPFADGDLVVKNSENRGNYTVRLTPDAEQYANFFGTKLLSSSLFEVINLVLFNNGVIPDYDIDVAVFFMDNFNGHNMAVQITQSIMDNDYNIEVYEPFELNKLKSVVSNQWQTHEEKLEAAEVVIIIAEDYDSLADLSDVYKLWSDRGLSPSFITVGYRPDYDDRDLLNASNLFMVVPDINFTKCPADVNTRPMAMGYAAGYITSKALETALSKTPAEPHGIQRLFMSPEQRMESHQNHLTQFRSAIISAMLSIDEDVPCYGNVDLSTDSTDWINLSLVRYKGNHTYESVSPSVVYNPIIDKLRDEFGLSSDTGEVFQ